MNLYNMFCNSWNSDLIAMEPYVFAHRPIVNVLLNHRNHYEPEKHTEDNASEKRELGALAHLRVSPLTQPFTAHNSPC